MATTKLGSAIASGKPAEKPAVSRFMAALAGKRVLEPITVPIVDLPAVMTILGAERVLDIDGDSMRAMEARGIPLNVATQGKYELETATRMLAEAVLESAANPVPLGSVKDWGSMPAEAIADLWLKYTDLRMRFDPSNVGDVSEEDIAEIRDAIAKKNSKLLLYFGVQKLTAYLLITADQPAISPTPKSASGDTSSES